jgi:hypothetical protein
MQRTFVMHVHDIVMESIDGFEIITNAIKLHEPAFFAQVLFVF